MAETPIIIDIEASGFGKGSYPIEIGVALANRQTVSYLIRPAEQWTHWSESAEAIHGIHRERLMAEGQEPRVVADQLNELLVGQIVYSDAWGFDSSWLGKLFDQARVLQGFRIETINKLLTVQQMEHWHAIKSQVWDELGIKERHRAASDVRVIQETFCRLNQQ